MTSQLEHLLSIPPIFDSVVVNLPTFSLLQLSRASYTIHKLLVRSRIAWSYFTFSDYQDPPRPSYQRHASSSTVYTASLTSHYHSPKNNSTNLDPGQVNYGRLSASFLTLDTVLTVLGRTLPLEVFVLLDLSWTRTEENMLRQLLDCCTNLEYLNVRMCPMRANQLLIALYGFEKSYVQLLRRDSNSMVTTNGTSAVVELLGRLRPMGIDEKGKVYVEHWFERRKLIDVLPQDVESVLTAERFTFSTASRRNENHCASLSPGIQLQLDFLREMTGSLALNELQYLVKLHMLRDVDHETFTRVVAGILTANQRPFKLRHLVTPKPNPRTFSSHLDSAASDAEEYLSLLCHCLGVELHGDGMSMLKVIEERPLNEWARKSSWLAAESAVRI